MENSELARVKKQRILGMDLVRIFSCICILCVHESFIPKPWIVSELFGYGSFGVQFFFVISGYFAASAFGDGKTNADVKSYYKKRLTRIIPAYYLAIIMIILWNLLIDIQVPTDVLHIGWFRYFLFLNTIVPSHDYQVWNNTNALWTMTDFFVFYLIAPWIYKKSNFKKVFFLLLISFGVKIIYKKLGMFVFANVEWIDKLDVLLGASPAGTLYQFIFGGLIYHIVQEKKRIIGAAMIVIVALAGLFTKQSVMTACSIGMILVILGLNLCKEIKLEWVERGIIILSDESFHIYLFHVLAMSIAKIVAERFEQVYIRYGIYIAIFIIVVLLCCMMSDFIERIVRNNKVINSK